MMGLFEQGDGVHGCVCLEQIRAVDLSTRRVEETGVRMGDSTMTRVLDGIGAMFGI